MSESTKTINDIITLAKSITELSSITRDILSRVKKIERELAENRENFSRYTRRAILHESPE